MNKELRYALAKDRWSTAEAVLQYLRAKGCFSHMSNPNNKDVNPYWYGAIAHPLEIARECRVLVESHSIKESRMREIAEEWKHNTLSPIVQLTALFSGYGHSQTSIVA